MVVGGAIGILDKNSFFCIIKEKGEGVVKKLFQKIKERIYKIMKIIKDNLLFSSSIILTVIFIISPIWLRIPIFEEIISLLLKPLKEQGFKSSYIETFGAILGTFLAISGALWTQRKFEQEAASREEEERKREKMLIIYYDFEFVFHDIKNTMSVFQFRKPSKNIGMLEDVDIDFFRKCWKKFKVHIYHDWIANVASVSKYFTKEEVKNIYKIYGDLDELRQIFKEPIKEISDSELKIAYSKMSKYIIFIIDLNSGQVEKVKIKEPINNILKKLQDIGGF